jgi:tripartite-type tricarboxylate transporter receptor subunit TctC
MKLPRRTFLHLAAGVAALPLMPHIARAQAYPTRPVRIIVGDTAGGAPDTVARLTGQWLSERLGAPFVIENRPGAGTNIATETVVRAPPDGYTLGMISTSAVISANLYDKLNFNLIRDIAPVAGICRAPLVMKRSPLFSRAMRTAWNGSARLAARTSSSASPTPQASPAPKLFSSDRVRPAR